MNRAWAVRRVYKSYDHHLSTARWSRNQRGEDTYYRYGRGHKGTYSPPEMDQEVNGNESRFRLARVSGAAVRDTDPV